MDVSPIYTNKGYHPNITVYPEQKIASQCACEYVVDLDELHMELHTQMLAAQKCYQGLADTHRNPAQDFRMRQGVFVNADHIHTTKSFKKLSEEYLRPYEITAQPGILSFILWLPEHMHAIHPMFHVSQLQLEIPNQILNYVQPAPPLIEINGELKYEIADILDSKIDNCRKCKLLYYI